MAFDGKAGAARASSHARIALLLLAAWCAGPPCVAVELLGPSSVGFEVGPSTDPDAQVIADLDGDGVLDIALANLLGDSVTILLGDGSGGFARVQEIPVGNSPQAIEVADFNTDGLPDLVVVNQESGSVNVLTGNGDGTFRREYERFGFAGPVDLVAEDLDADGATDLAVVNRDGGSSVSILLGDGDGGFGAPILEDGVGPFSIALAAADFDRNGSVDLAVVNVQGNSVSILINDGAGLFTPQPVDVTVGSFPSAIAADDLDGNGDADLAVANAIGNSVSILMGDGAGGFVLSAEPAVDAFPLGLAIGDLDDDGTADLAVINFDGNSVSILQGNGEGRFVRRCLPRSGRCEDRVCDDLTPCGNNADCEDVGSGTCNLRPCGSDGDCAEIGAGSCTLGLCEDQVNSCAIDADCAGIGGGACMPTCSEIPSSSPTSVAMADLNGDGASDLAVTNQVGDTVSVLLGDGLGGLTGAPEVAVGQAPQSVARGDFAGDGAPDLAVTNTLSGTLSILVNDGNGGFSTAADLAEVFEVPVSTVAGDFNGDGFDDLAVASLDSFDKNVSILLGDGSGGFVRKQDVDLPKDRAGFVTTGDVDGDESLDLIVVHATRFQFSGNAVSILLGQGDGTFVFHGELSVRDDIGAAALGDFDGDGDLDLAVTNFITFSVRIFLGLGDGSFQGPEPDIVGNSGEGPVSIVSGHFDGNEHLDLAVPLFNRSSVAILLGQGNGTFERLDSDVPVGRSPRSVATTEINADGETDLIVTNAASDSVSLLLGRGDGGFVRAPDVGVGDDPAGIAAGDFNLDGAIDVAVVNRLDDTVSILLNQLAARADTNGSNRIDGFDISAIGRRMGADARTAGYDRASDVNLDGQIDGDDLSLSAEHFGELSRLASPLRPNLDGSVAPDHTITVQPLNSQGDLLTARVLVSDADHFSAAADFAVTFEPIDGKAGQVLEWVGFEPGSFLSGGVGQIYTVDSDTRDRVEIGISSLPARDESGSGAESLIDLVFRARREGVAELRFAAFRRGAPMLLDAANQPVGGVSFIGSPLVRVNALSGGPPGQKIGVVPDCLEFRRVEPGETSRRTLRISNFGFSELTVTEVNATTAEFFSFSVASFSIPPFGSLELTVEFSPATSGVFSGELVIESDDPGHADQDGDGFGELRVPVSGRSEIAP